MAYIPDNNTVERSMRPIKLSKKNSLFAGSRRGIHCCRCPAIRQISIRSNKPSPSSNDNVSSQAGKWETLSHPILKWNDYIGATQRSGEHLPPKPVLETA
jgi:hypothetical protein